MDHRRPYQYILIDNEPIACDDLLAWAQWFEDFENRRCFISTVGPYTVSTIFLGLDHNFSSNGPPVLFETMAWVTDAAIPTTIFGKEATVRDFLDEQERCSTMSDAQSQHLAFCASIALPGDRIEHIYSRLKAVDSTAI